MRIKDGKVITIPCTGCGNEIEEENIKRLLTNNEFTKYQQFRFFAQLRLEPDCRWCPKKSCENGMVANRDDPNFPMLKCDQCDTQYCFHCSLKWHPKMSCEKMRKRVEGREKGFNKRAIKKNKKWLKENKVIKCKRCGQGVQKKDGCNHMTCTCGFEFCWLCGDTILSTDLHFTLGACAGLQYSKRENLGVVRNTARVGLLAGMVVGGGVLALGLAVPVVAAGAVAVPIYGGYRLVKYRQDKKEKKRVEKEKQQHDINYKKLNLNDELLAVLKEDLKSLQEKK